MSEYFFEIVLRSEDFHLDGRDEVEDPLDEALQAAGVGEVSGGGSGLGASNIDVDASDFEAALAIIRRVLLELGVAQSTKIKSFDPNRGQRQTLSLMAEENRGQALDPL